MIKNKTYRGHALGIALGITMMLLLLAGGASAATPVSSCGTISSPGEYVLNTNLAGPGQPWACISITSSDVIFDGAGHWINGTGQYDTEGITAGGTGIKLTNVTVKNLNVANWSVGILYEYVLNGNISNNIASKNTNFGIRVVYSGNNITVSDNTASNNGAGLISNFGAGIMLSSDVAIAGRVSGNTASDNYYYGIWLQAYSSNITVSSNTALNNSLGIYIGYSSNSTISSNTASNNTFNYFKEFGNNYGIWLLSSNNNTISGNTVSNNSGGFYLIDSSNNTLIGNTISNNSNNFSQGVLLSTIYYGIILQSSNNNTIYNNIFNNTNNFIEINSINTWNITKTLGTNIIGGNYLGGNFWAYPNGKGFSQTCADGDNDGICDSPYVLDSNNTDYLPLTNRKPTANVGPVSSCGTISYPGVYVLTKNLASPTTCIRITSSDVILDGAGYWINGTGKNYGYAGIMVYNPSTKLTNVTVKNLNVANWYFGIDYENINNGTISNSIVSNNSGGVYVNSSSNITVSGQTVLNNSDFGIFLGSSSNSMVSSSTESYSSNFGIWLSSSSKITVSGNNATYNLKGIILDASSNITVSSNNASNNSIGIELIKSGNITVSSNNASNNDYGVWLLSSSNNIIYNNIFNNSNNFIETGSMNTLNITKTLGTNIISGPYLGGNFWANPSGTGFSQTCPDKDRDGICDSAYVLDSNNTDYLPLRIKSAPGFEAVFVIGGMLVVAYMLRRKEN